MSGLFLAIVLALILVLAESYSNIPRNNAALTATKNLIVSNSGWRSVSKSSSGSRLYAAAPEAPKKGPPPRKAPKDDVIQVNGRVIESLPNAMFRVEIEPSKQLVLATISGKIRKNSVRIVVGDSVVCELSAYDLTRGRITYRNK